MINAIPVISMKKIMTPTNDEKADASYSRPTRSLKKMYNGWITHARTIAKINGTAMNNNVPNGAATGPKKNPIIKINPIVKITMISLITKLMFQHEPNLV